MLSKYSYKEKVYICGEYLEIDLIPTFQIIKSARRKKIKKTDPVQRNLNDKNSKRHFIQKANTNFSKNDYHITCTYKNKYRPTNFEDAQNELKNYFRRLNYHSNKKGFGNIKYMAVTEESGSGKLHHHIIMSSMLKRDFIESLWSVGRGKNKKTLGLIRSSYLQPDENGIEALARYITKTTIKGKKRWMQSDNLDQPFIIPVRRKYTKRHIEKIKRSGKIFERQYWENKYKGYLFEGLEEIIELLPHHEKKEMIKHKNYTLTDIEEKYNDFTGFSYYVKMRRR